MHNDYVNPIDMIDIDETQNIILNSEFIILN